MVHGINDIIKDIQNSISVKESILKDDVLLDSINEAVKIITEKIKVGKKLLIAGNGGSAADAQHIAGELVGKFLIERKALPAIALTTDTSIITSLSNDIDYNVIFRRQLEALGTEGDVFLAISTSGNSTNLLEALDYCKEHNIYAIGLTGITGGKMKEMVDLLINVPSNSTPRIQESHIMIYHIMCQIIELESTKQNEL